MKWAIIGSALLTTAMVVAVLLLVAVKTRDTEFETAAKYLDGQNVRLAVKLDARQDGEMMAMTGTALQNADGTHSRFEVDAIYEEGDEPVRQTLLLIDRDVWVGGKTAEDVLPLGKRWLQSEEPQGSPLLMNMQRVAVMLRNAQEVSEAGETTVRGKPVTHYRARLNLQDMLEKAGAEGERWYSSQIGSEEVILPLELWVGEDGRPARVTLKSNVNGYKMSWAADILHYGPEVVVQVPPAAETITEKEFDALSSE